MEHFHGALHLHYTMYVNASEQYLTEYMVSSGFEQCDTTFSFRLNNSRLVTFHSSFTVEYPIYFKFLISITPEDRMRPDSILFSREECQLMKDEDSNAPVRKAFPDHEKEEVAAWLAQGRRNLQQSSSAQSISGQIGHRHRQEQRPDLPIADELFYPSGELRLWHGTEGDAVKPEWVIVVIVDGDVRDFKRPSCGAACDGGVASLPICHICTPQADPYIFNAVQHQSERETSFTSRAPSTPLPCPPLPNFGYAIVSAPVVRGRAFIARLPPPQSLFVLVPLPNQGEISNSKSGFGAHVRPLDAVEFAERLGECLWVV
ncbi:hypothetical protein HYFRA_00001087 [Hymenoscyphus fraxineus]|uniref:Uncharacterized protein n=1 Tax=Hymenoscyphus fraxineus TaxID=746836 RepID=A0A9N9PMG8_9HELO|nr:hypothetical protein HYFRA_00001087 [Hymenoscyphus fraxineus]